jgi:hypothetical protein
LEGLKIELINYGIKISYGTFVSSSSRELDPVIMVSYNFKGNLVKHVSKILYFAPIRQKIYSLFSGIKQNPIIRW